MSHRTPGMPRYRLDFKLHALSELDRNEGRIYQTARQLGIARQTLHSWHRDRDKLHREVEKLRQQRGFTLSDQFDALIQQMVAAIPEKLERARFSDIARVLPMLLELSKSIKAEAEAEDGSDVYEKLAQLINRYADRTAESDDDFPESDGGELP